MLSTCLLNLTEKAQEYRGSFVEWEQENKENPKARGRWGEEAAVSKAVN